MQLTSFTDYGLRSLIYLSSLPEHEMTSITQVTAVFGLSRNHMVKIVNQLSKAGFIKAVRGKNGGIKLGMPADQITIGAVVKAIEPLALVNCSVEACHITSACRLKFMLNDAVEAFIAELEKHTISDLIIDNQPLKQLLSVIPHRPL